MSLLPVGIGAFDSGYTIDQSLRLRSSAVAMFRRTPSSAGNRRTWTISWWAKRGLLGSTGFTVFSAGTSATGDTGELVIKYDNNYPDSLAIQTGTTNIRFTNALYRDPSAWHHVVVAFDTTQATAANRHKVYVNGEQITSFNLSNDLAQNTDTAVNNTVQQAWGYFGRINSQYFDGYLAEMYIIDGQQLTANDFGEFDDDTGVWKPKAYSGTYGTNGAYLNGTGTTYIEDVSGNNNDFANVNLQLTDSTASTYDSMADVPTLNDADTANFATLNPVDTYPSRQFAVDGNLKWNDTSGGSWGRSTISPTTGKWYWEVSGFSTTNWFIGVSDGTKSITNYYAYYVGAPTALVYLINGNTYIAGSNASFISAIATTDVVGFAVDADAGSLAVYKNGTLQGTITGLSYGSYSPMVAPPAAGSCVYNFGQRPFAYTPPTGFLKINTFNLPDSTIEDGSDYFNTVLWTGNTTTNGVQQAITGVGFQPDFVWAKTRNQSFSHYLYDSVRGVGSSGKLLQSNNTNAEATNVEMDSFDTDGFTVEYGSTQVLNWSSSNNVGWSWKASGTTASNTVGTIPSTVSANTTAGFSIVSYTGTNSNSTVGHGLGVAPSMVICKNRTAGIGSGSWPVWHTGLSSGTSYLFLNSTAAQASGNNNFTSAPSSTVLNLGTSDTNNTATMIAYCFAEVEGYSSFGSYTGNGNSDGTFVYTGFRPAFVVIKESTSTGSWVMLDTTRSTYNVINNDSLWADLSSAEGGSSSYFDMLSNGFKIRDTDSDKNTSGQTYIYMAFAENPFKNALAR